MLYIEVLYISIHLATGFHLRASGIMPEAQDPARLGTAHQSVGVRGYLPGVLLRVRSAAARGVVSGNGTNPVRADHEPEY